MLRGLEFAPGDSVIEYGPGTGSFTKAIVERMRAVPNVHYLGIERDPGFCNVLRERFPDLIFENGQVEDVEKLIKMHGLRKPIAVISGLPLVVMPSAGSIIKTVSKILADGGSFRTFSYVHAYPTPGAGRLRALMREAFPKFEISPFVIRNMPPAMVLKGFKAGG